MERTTSANRVRDSRYSVQARRQLLAGGNSGKWIAATWVIAALVVLAVVGQALAAEQHLDHQQWHAMLQKYVSEKGRVDYARWQDNDSDRLDAYLRQLAEPWPESLTDQQRKAAQINAYNALTVRWILRHYPIKSIWETESPFKGPHHTVNGETISLDGLETGLRATGDPRIHAALVCAARSCPPLRDEAYQADRLEEQLDDTSQRWLADSRLNLFALDTKTAELSPILDWYSADFAASGGVRSFVERYAPPGIQASLVSTDWNLRYGSYHWGLNDDSPLGWNYTRVEEGADRLRSGDLWGKVKIWFFGLGTSYGVNPVIFGLIYVGAIPFFSLSVAWLIRNLRRKQSVLAPAMLASFFFVSAYLYLLVAGKNIPVWVYGFLGAMLIGGVVSTVRKIRTGIQAH